MSETTLFIAGMIPVLILILVLISHKSSAKNKSELSSSEPNEPPQKDHTADFTEQQNKSQSFECEGVKDTGSTSLPEKQSKTVQVIEPSTRHSGALKVFEDNITPLIKGVQEDDSKEPTITIEREIIHDENSHRLPRQIVKVSIRGFAPIPSKLTLEHRNRL